MASGDSTKAESADGQLELGRAREAAKKLLAEHRQNLGMWAAYAGLECKAKLFKVGILGPLTVY